MKDMPGTENISKKNGYYVVSKSISSVICYVGSAKTLIEALMMRDWAIVNGWRKYPKSTQTAEKYISLAGGSYIVTKTIGGKQRYYGGFNNLEKAIEHRDYCIKNGWSSNCRYVNENRNIRKKWKNYEVYYTLDGKCTYYGGYPTLEHAREVRDLAEKYDGDWDLMCEGFEFEEECWMEGKITFNNFFEKNKDSPKDLFIARYNGIFFRGAEE